MQDIGKMNSKLIINVKILIVYTYLSLKEIEEKYRASNKNIYRWRSGIL